MLVVLPSASTPLVALISHLSLLQSCASPQASEADVYVLTHNVHKVTSGRVQPQQAGAWGLSRAARAEAPSLNVRCADVGAGEWRAPHYELIVATARALHQVRDEPEMALARGGLVHVPRLAVAGHPLNSNSEPVAGPPAEPHTHLVTGGTGGLGLLTASWLAQSSISEAWLVLISRSGRLAAPDSSGSRGGASTRTARRVVYRCDASEVVETRSLIARMRCTLPPLRGLWHTAGLLADALLANQDASHMSRSHGPKSHGASHLHRGHASEPLEACVYFSSIAGLVGGPAQANYASANTCLDALATWRRSRGSPAVSIDWGPWAEVGMAASSTVNSRMGAMGLGLIDPWQGLAALQEAIRPNRPAVFAFWLVRWDVLLAQGRESAPAMLRELAPRVSAAERTPRVDTTPVVSCRAVRVDVDVVLEMASRTTGAAVDADTPLMDAGLDSLGAVELQNMIQQAVGKEAALPSSLVLDYPTARSLAAFLHVHSVAEECDPAAAVGCTPAPTSALDLAALSSHLGGMFETSDEHASLVRLRAAKSDEAAGISLVIMHSFLGDELGYERLWKMHLGDRAIFAIRHPYLVSSDADALPITSASMISLYTAALVATFGKTPFDLIGASYGSLVTHHVARAARAAGACPRKVVLVDPFPSWARIRETAPDSALLSSRESDARSAAHFILRLRLNAQYGAEEGEARLQTLVEAMSAVPSDAVHLFLAAQALPEASTPDLFVQALKEHRRIRTVSSIAPTILDLVETIAPFTAPFTAPFQSGQAAVMMVLSSERMAFYKEVYGHPSLEDALGQYGPTVAPILVEGEHFDVVARCISNRVPEFTAALVEFLSGNVDDDA